MIVSPLFEQTQFSLLVNVSDEETYYSTIIIAYYDTVAYETFNEWSMKLFEIYFLVEDNKNLVWLYGKLYCLHT